MQTYLFTYSLSLLLINLFTNLLSIFNLTYLPIEFIKLL